MESVNTAGPKPTNNRLGILYPVMLIAAIALIVFSVVGIATMVGWMPSALSGADPEARPAAAPAAVTSAEPRIQARIVSNFSEFAGSTGNARSLVAGLRRSGEVTLTAPGSGMGTRFTPPMRAMTYRDVRISLALAQEQLGQLGIRPNTSTNAGQ